MCCSSSAKFFKRFTEAYNTHIANAKALIKLCVMSYLYSLVVVVSQLLSTKYYCKRLQNALTITLLAYHFPNLINAIGLLSFFTAYKEWVLSDAQIETYSKYLCCNVKLCIF